MIPIFSAQEFSAGAGQKTLTAAHIFQAIESIGFGDWSEVLQSSLDRRTNLSVPQNMRLCL